MKRELTRVNQSHKSTKNVRINYRFCFYQTGSAWSIDQGCNKNHSSVNSFALTVTVVSCGWAGNCRGNIVVSRASPGWSLIHGLSGSGLIKAEPCKQNVYRCSTKKHMYLFWCIVQDIHDRQVCLFHCVTLYLRLYEDIWPSSRDMLYFMSCRLHGEDWYLNMDWYMTKYWFRHISIDSTW